MAVAEDASTPPVVRSAVSSTVATLTTASFTPPAGSLLVIYNLWSWHVAWTSTPTLSASASAGGTPTQVAQLADTTGKFNVCGCWYLYLASSPGAITVSATRAVSTAGAGGMLAVRVLTGSQSTASQLYAATAAISSASSTTHSVTPSSVGSELYIGTAADQNGATLTSISGTTTLDSWQDTTDSINLGTGKSTALTSTTAAQNFGWTCGLTSGQETTIIVEVPPASNPVVPPTGLTATVISSTEIDLSWNTVAGAKGYDLQRDGVVIATDLTGLSYADTGLSPSTTYTYDVRSVF